MITPTIFYQQMKKWVSTDDDRPKFQHIWFDGERAFATDSHRLAIVKQYPAREAHWETVKGIRNDNIPNSSPLDYDKVIVKEDRIRWRKNISFSDYRQSKGFFMEFRDILAALARIARNRRDGRYVILQKYEEKLYAYAANTILGAKILMLDNMQGDEVAFNWEAGFNSLYLETAMDFLKATEPSNLSIYINDTKWPIITFDTEDLLLLVCSINLDRVKDERLMNFYDSERPGKPEPEKENEDADIDDILG